MERPPAAITATISHGARVTKFVLYNGPKITAKSTQIGYSKLPPMDPFQNLLSVDIGFTALVHSFESAKEVVEKDFGMKKVYDFKPTFKFKSLLVVDGHTLVECTAKAVGALLACASEADLRINAQLVANQMSRYDEAMCYA
ncbi:hypothetical protein HDU77_001598, partial [Chytriomyces hyalinus]